uniref:Small heat shock protein ArHsp21 n=1 Tax=Artemia franciscana TaxID=6661 RepID=Q1WDN9_ARTSF|nr:small heat shock protein ArHsp21 [Artemia franciscana]
MSGMRLARSLLLLGRPQSRHLFWGRRTWDPFEELRMIMREMENQFQNINQNVFKALPSSFKEETAVPVISSKGDDNMYRLVLDLSGFKPEDVKIDLMDRNLRVTGKCEQKTSDGCRMYHETQREYLLPENVNLNELKSAFTDSGYLTIEAPMPEGMKPKEIPINRGAQQIESESKESKRED